MKAAQTFISVLWRIPAPNGPRGHEHVEQIALLLVGLSACGQDRILSFDSDITVNADGSLAVHETIHVIASGDKIKRDSYRDFPTDYRTDDGKTMRSRFEIDAELRDDANESFQMVSRPRAKPWYLNSRAAI